MCSPTLYILYVHVYIVVQCIALFDSNQRESFRITEFGGLDIGESSRVCSKETSGMVWYGSYDCPQLICTLYTTGVHSGVMMNSFVPGMSLMKCTALKEDYQVAHSVGL